MGTSSHLDSLFALQGIGSYAITSGGTDAQKDTWLPRVLTGEALAALALTEPEAGLGPQGHHHRPLSRGHGYLLNGEKAYISNGGAAAFYSVLAREGDGYTMVLVPADSPGLTVTATPELAAPHVLGDLTFECRPRRSRAADRRAAAAASTSCSRTLAVFRLSVAGASLGLAQAALEEAVHHAANRRAVRQAARPPGRGRRDAGRFLGGARGGAPAHLSCGRARARRPGRRASPLLDGQADRRARRPGASSTGQSRSWAAGAWCATARSSV